MLQSNDRVSMGHEDGLIYGTVLEVATDGEVKVKFDGIPDAFWYPPQAVQLVELDSPEEIGYTGLRVIPTYERVWNPDLERED